MNPSETTDDSALAGSRYSQVVSLGYNCYAASVIRRLGLERNPMPFDWLSTTVPMVQHCIEDDFAHLLDRQYYKRTEYNGQTQIKHAFYPSHWTANFTHSDPTDGMGRVYLERCIDRWRDMMALPEPKMLMFMNQIFAHERDRYVGEFEALTAAITRLTAGATVVGVTIAATGEAPGFAEARRIGDNRLFHYTASGPMKGIEFENPEDDARIDRFVLDYVDPAR